MNIYVGNLSYSTTEGELRDAFGSFGEVTSVAIISDKFTGQSKGFGFVEMADKDAATKAISSLDGSEIKGRQIKVNEARPREQRSEGGGGGSRGGSRGPRSGGGGGGYGGGGGGRGGDSGGDRGGRW